MRADRYLPISFIVPAFPFVVLHRAASHGLHFRCFWIFRANQDSVSEFGRLPALHKVDFCREKTHPTFQTSSSHMNVWNTDR